MLTKWSQTQDKVSQARGEVWKNSPQPAGYTPTNAAQRLVGCICCKDTLLTRAGAVHWDPQDFFCKAAL